VRTVRQASEDEVLECFWAGELGSPRWTPADIDERERQWRERDALFGGFPDDVRWELAALTREELLDVLYINWDWWLRVSRGTRLPRVAAEVQGRDDGDRAIAERAAVNPPLIVVTDPARSQLVVLEGHVRLTAYAAFPELLPDEVELYLGSSPKIATWCQW
jgi:hypothetical protein